MFVDMFREIHGSVPKIPIPFCKTLVNRAYRDARRQNLWSFLLFDSNWTSPNLVNTGTATVTQGLNTVVVNAAAGVALQAIALGPPTPLTQRQFRLGLGTIYNIWGWNNGTLTLTLDRPYQEVSAAGAVFTVGQYYYPTPMSDFLGWISIRDMVNYRDLYFDKTRSQIDDLDPQRSIFYTPTDAVYYQQDQNPNSPTYKFPMFELWSSPQYMITYQLYGMRRGTDLVANSDSLPPALGEDCVLALAKKYAYEWAEANKGDSPRNSGPDFKFLIGNAQADYNRLFKSYRKDDRETVDNWFSIRRPSAYGSPYAYYNAISQTANPGGSPW